MSEKSPRLSPRSQDKFKGRSETPGQNASERPHFDEEIFPISPRESPTPSNSSRHHRHRSSRRHHHDSSARDRDRHRGDTHSSSSNNKNRKHRGESLNEIEAEVGSEHKRRKVYHETKSDEKHSRRDRDRTRTKESKKGHRKEKDERKELKDKRSHRHEYVDERESYYQHEKEKSVESLKREHSCSVSRQSSVVHPTTHESKNSPQSSSKSSLNPFVATLLKPLLKEDTSDIELEELLPAGILSGEMAKRSIPLPRSIDQPKRGLTPQSHSQASQKTKSQEHQVDSSSQEQQGATTSTGESSDQKQPVDENESRFDKFLSNLSDRLQEKEQEVETWSVGAIEVDFSDILIEEEDTIRIVASPASLKPKQLLEACLSTPWDSLERRTEDDNDKSEKTDEDKEEDPFDLVSLLSSNICRRYLDDELVKELEERGITLSSTAEKDCRLSVDNFKSKMVPGVYEEKAWRRSLLGITSV